MKRPKQINIREVFKSKGWEITNVIEDDGRYRISAKRTFPLKNELNCFIGYGSKMYCEGLALTYYDKNIHEI